MAEVAFHRRRFLEDAHLHGEQRFEYRDFLADLTGDFSNLDEEERATCLLPEPIPQCYQPGQALAKALLDSGASGIVYPSVRQTGGTCIACFCPALIFHPRRGGLFTLSVEAGVPWNNSNAQRLNES